MILRIDREKYKNTYDENTGVEYEIIEDDRICYVGNILNDNQIRTFQKYENTIIPYKVYKYFEEKDRVRVLLEELKRLVGFKVEIKVLEESEGSQSVYCYKARKFYVKKSTGKRGTKIIVKKWGKPYISFKYEDYMKQKQILEYLEGFYAIQEHEVEFDINIE